MTKQEDKFGLGKYTAGGVLRAVCSGVLCGIVLSIPILISPKSGEEYSKKITQLNEARQRNTLVSEVMKEYDTNRDGQLSLEELGAMQSALVFSKGQPNFQQYLSTYSNEQLKTLLEAKK